MAASVEIAADGVGQVKQFLHDQHLLDMKTWVGEGPKSFTGLAVFGAFGMIFTGLTGLLGSLFSPLHAVIEAYILLFGLLIVAVEPRCQKIPVVRLFCCFKGKKPLATADEETGISGPKEPEVSAFKALIRKEAKFLTVLAGRGYFYIFVGTLLVSQGALTFQGLLGIYMIVVGIMHTVIGLHAADKMAKMKNHIKDEKEVRALFKKYDEDRSGTLSASELANLCKELGSELDQDELLLAMECLSAGHDASEIKYGEFFTWWKQVSADVE